MALSTASAAFCEQTPTIDPALRKAFTYALTGLDASPNASVVANGKHAWGDLEISSDCEASVDTIRPSRQPVLKLFFDGIDPTSVRIDPEQANGDKVIDIHLSGPTKVASIDGNTTSNLDLQVLNPHPSMTSDSEWDTDRIIRAWTYIFQNGCAGQTAPFRAAAQTKRPRRT